MWPRLQLSNPEAELWLLLSALVSQHLFLIEETDEPWASQGLVVPAPSHDLEGCLITVSMFSKASHWSYVTWHNTLGIFAVNYTSVYSTIFHYEVDICRWQVDVNDKLWHSNMRSIGQWHLGIDAFTVMVSLRLHCVFFYSSVYSCSNNSVRSLNPDLTKLIQVP